MFLSLYPFTLPEQSLIDRDSFFISKFAFFVKIQIQLLQWLIHSFQSWFPIRVRLCRLCYAIIPNKNGELISIEMIFVDEKVRYVITYNVIFQIYNTTHFHQHKYQGNLMHGIVRKNQVNRFKGKLSEGSSFIIKNLKVVESTGGHRLIENSLKDLYEDIVDIPKNGIHFIKPYMIDSSRYLYIDAGPYIVIVTTTTVKEFCILPIQLVLEAIRTYRVEVFPTIHLEVEHSNKLTN
ncbi:hypothetical protein H5410_039298 [Solanum commersonii]|uniref:Uncharacterized protein n=1 Tax=Solanum commersonii TaxID=4109 RepID=A0A9J5YCZ4_SOLCO|nr:hypothetical protein H5410_039298 [Solanum commersonii]